MAGLVVFLVLVVFRGGGAATNNGLTTNSPLVTTPQKTAAAQKNVPPSPAAIAVGRRFIETAVARKNLAQAYSFVTGAVKGGLTKKQWESGSIPVTPYPAENAATTKFQVISSHPTRALFQLTLVETRGSRLSEPQLQFNIGLRRAGGKPNGRWLVDYWAPYYTAPILKSVGGG